MTDRRAQQLLKAYRRAATPDDADRDRVWARLTAPDADGVESPEDRAASSSLNRTWTKVAAACFAIAAGFLLILAAASRYTSSPGPRVEPNQAIDERMPEAPRDLEREGSSPRPLPKRRDPPDAASEVPYVEAASRVSERSSHRAPPSERSESREREPGPPSSLAAEMKALERVRTILGRDPRRALDLLDAYARRFPHGQLAVEARALRIVSLCESGATIAGRGEARVFLSAHPRSPYASRIEAECELR